MEKQREKAARRLQRKQEGPAPQEEIQLLHGPPPPPEEDELPPHLREQQ
jgi:hypothetical protein